MKILHNVTIWLPLTQTWIYTQLKYLPDGVDSQVACLKTENIDQFGDVSSIYCLQENSSRVEYFVRRVMRITRLKRNLGWLRKPLEEFNPDLIHSHFGPVGWQALPEIKNRIPHVVTFYGYDLSRLPHTNPWWKIRYKELFTKVTGVLCEGEHMASRIESLGCNAAKIHVHRLGIRIDQIAYRPRIWDGKEPLRILLAGTFTEKKGLPYALAALSRLSKDIPVQVTIIGDVGKYKKDQQEKRKIIQTIKDGGINANVNFMGYQPHNVLFEQAYKHHVFLSPSVTAASGDVEGGAPVTIIEMAATGMPVVSTNHCDIPGVILDGETGLLAEERDVNGLYEKLLWLISNPEKWRAMLERGRVHIEKYFDARKQGINLAEIYEQLA
jgi:colanic acid/amylovoran biosynthesis glycosyltransferase